MELGSEVYGQSYESRTLVVKFAWHELGFIPKRSNRQNNLKHSHFNLTIASNRSITFYQTFVWCLDFRPRTFLEVLHASLPLDGSASRLLLRHLVIRLPGSGTTPDREPESPHHLHQRPPMQYPSDGPAHAECG